MTQSSRSLSLSDRLAAIAELVPAGARLADVCADHALLGCKLALDNAVRRVIAVDIGEAPCAVARANARRLRVVSTVEVRLGGGLDPIARDEVDTVVVAGLGGRAALEILTPQALGRVDPRVVIVQPNKRVAQVREALCADGWSIVDERLVEELGRFYSAMRFERGPSQRLSWLDLELGPRLRERGGATFLRFLDHTIDWVRARNVAMERADAPGLHRASEELLELEGERELQRDRAVE